MQIFHSRPRVISHIEESSVRCKTVLLHTFSALPNDIVAALDERDAAEARRLRRKGRSRNYSDSATSRLPGPLLWEAYAVGISHASLLKTQGPTSTANMIANISS